MCVCVCVVSLSKDKKNIKRVNIEKLSHDFYFVVVDISFNQNFLMKSIEFIVTLHFIVWFFKMSDLEKMIFMIMMEAKSNFIQQFSGLSGKYKYMYLTILFYDTA